MWGHDLSSATFQVILAVSSNRVFWFFLVFFVVSFWRGVQTSKLLKIFLDRKFLDKNRGVGYQILSPPTGTPLKTIPSKSPLENSGRKHRGICRFPVK